MTGEHLLFLSLNYLLEKQTRCVKKWAQRGELLLISVVR